MLQSMRAKFGRSLSHRAVLFGWATLDDLLEAAYAAEQSGYFHGVWVGDNLLSKPRAEAIVTLSAIAVRTRQVKLETICLASFPLRAPILLAIQWAGLDLLSHGRTILAVCKGGSALDGPTFAHELEVMGVPSGERVGRVVGGMTILRRLWSEGRVTYRGQYCQFTDVEILSKRVQQPLPIYMAINPKEQRLDAAVIDRILRRVAAHADGWQTDATPVETFQQRFATIRMYAAQGGLDPSRLDSCLHLMVNLNDDRDVAFRESETFLSPTMGWGPCRANAPNSG